MSLAWGGPAWGEPSTANEVAVPLRASGWSGDAAYRAEGGWSDRWLVLAASVAGVSHRLAGRRGEDCFGWAQPAPERLALVIADGVSTAGRGGQGADLAVQAACKYLGRPRPADAGWGDVDWAEAERGEMECLEALGAASRELTSAGGGEAAELSTTFVVALLSPQEATARAVVARVGDSTAFTLSAGGAWRELFGSGPEDPFVPSRGGETYQDFKAPLPAVLPLSETAPRPEVVHATLPAGTTLVLLTDGIADPLRDGPNTVAPALAGAVLAASRGELSPLALAQAADFSRRGAHDDRTIILAWPRAAR